MNDRQATIQLEMLAREGHARGLEEAAAKQEAAAYWRRQGGDFKTRDLEAAVDAWEQQIEKAWRDRDIMENNVSVVMGRQNVVGMAPAAFEAARAQDEYAAREQAKAALERADAVIDWRLSDAVAVLAGRAEQEAAVADIEAALAGTPGGTLADKLSARLAVCYGSDEVKKVYEAAKKAGRADVQSWLEINALPRLRDFDKDMTPEERRLKSEIRAAQFARAFDELEKAERLHKRVNAVTNKLRPGHYVRSDQIQALADKFGLSREIMAEQLKRQGRL